MKKTLTTVARKLLSPSLRYEIRLLASKMREMLARACLWRWEVARFRPQQESPYEILYIGRKQQREMAKLLEAAYVKGRSDGMQEAVQGIAKAAAKIGVKVEVQHTPAGVRQAGSKRTQ